MSNNLLATVLQLDLAALATTANKEHEATVLGLSYALEHALAAGAALIKAQDALKHGQWSPWLARYCPNISERTARNYMALARARGVVLEANRQRVADLSLRGALALLSSPRSKGGTPRRKKTQDATSFDALGWWSTAPLEARRHFIDDIGSRDLAAAIPPSWNLVLVRADAGESIGRIGRLNERIAQLEDKLRDRDRRIEKLQRALGPVFGVAKAEASPEKPAPDLDSENPCAPAGRDGGEHATGVALTRGDGRATVPDRHSGAP